RDHRRDRPGALTRRLRPPSSASPPASALACLVCDHHDGNAKHPASPETAMDLNAIERAPSNDGYLFSPGQAWFAFAMTMALMIFDYVDRQVIVSLFPHLKAAWGMSDMQLGGLVSVVSVTVALGALPVALYADRV